MVHKVLFWGGFGVAVRLWQLGIMMRPFFGRSEYFTYPLYAGVGASFGYWLKGVEDKQVRILAETRDRLLEKRRRRAEEGTLYQGTTLRKDDESVFPSPKLADSKAPGLA